MRLVFIGTACRHRKKEKGKRRRNCAYSFTNLLKYESVWSASDVTTLGTKDIRERAKMYVKGFRPQSPYFQVNIRYNNCTYINHKIKDSKQWVSRATNPPDKHFSWCLCEPSLAIRCLLFLTRDIPYCCEINLKRACKRYSFLYNSPFFYCHLLGFCLSLLNTWFLETTVPATDLSWKTKHGSMIC